jgi:hypothetical protein
MFCFKVGKKGSIFVVYIWFILYCWRITGPALWMDGDHGNFRLKFGHLVVSNDLAYD